jgi:hypothetical protein
MSFKCDKHKLRKRKSCPDCQKELEESKIETVENSSQEDVIEANISLSEPIFEEGQVVSQVKDIKPIIEEIPKPDTTSIEEYFNKRLKLFEEQVGHICNISYEHLAISLALFNKKIIGELEDDGWRVLSLLTGSIAVNSGFDEDTVLFQRVKTKFRKYTQDETYKRCVKEKEGK